MVTPVGLGMKKVTLYSMNLINTKQEHKPHFFSCNKSLPPKNVSCQDEQACSFPTVHAVSAILIQTSTQVRRNAICGRNALLD